MKPRISHFVYYWRSVALELIAKYSLMQIILLAFAALLVVLFLIFIVVGMWQMFKKANYKAYWSLIPLYNLYLLNEISGNTPLFFWLLFLPGISIVAWLKICLGLSENFGKGKGFAVGLWLCPWVFFLILGYGDSICLNALDDDDDVHWVKM